MKWMKVDAACAHAGGVHRKLIYAAVKAGDLRAARIGAGRNFLFSDVWIDEWLQNSSRTDERLEAAATVRASEKGFSVDDKCTTPNAA